jgi:hypothetical protein
MFAEALAIAGALAVHASAVAPPVLELRPSTLTLGQGERARIVVRSAAGAPRVISSAGTVGPLEELEPGVFAAQLEPPLSSHPQVALVAAVAPGGVAFACLPLVGRGVAVARTEPRARITVQIRDRTFGPADADERGIALVPVEVPPGERFARHRGKPLDLRVPPLERVLVLVDPPPARADVEETVTVHAFAATAQGAPWAGAPIALEVSAGRLEPAREVAPGAFSARWTLPPAHAGEVLVEARVPDAPPAAARLRRPAGPVARVAFRLAADRAHAGDPPLEVLLETSDAAGNRVDADVRLRASPGALDEPVRVSPGVLRTAYRVPERLEGAREVVLEASLGEATDSRRLALAAGPAAALSLELTRSELLAGGGASADATVTVVDRFGNGVDAPAPVVEAGRGSVGPVSAEAPGRWRARYVPVWSRSPGEDAVVARAGDLVARAPVRLLEPPRRLGATLRGGALHALGGFTAPYLGLGLEAWPLRLGGAWGVALAVGRAATSRDERAVIGGGDHALSAASAHWPIELSALARRPLRPRLTALGGAGVKLVRVHSELGLDGVRTADEWGWAPGLQATGGVALEVPSLRARVRLEAALGWQADPGMETLRGSMTTLGILVGVTHDAL